MTEIKMSFDLNYSISKWIQSTMFTWVRGRYILTIAKELTLY